MLTMSLPATFATDDIPGLSPDVETCVARILDAFSDLSRESGFLAVATEAERACPGNPIVLCLAAMAALFDGEAARAQVYLKRYSKRAHAGPAHHLLSALTLAAQGKRDVARQLLERQELETLGSAAEYFPGGMRRLYWLHDATEKSSAASRICAPCGRGPKRLGARRRQDRRRPSRQ